MALTQDQSTALQTAIEHLNQSVEVNKQILEMLKSVGNTGVVDIATHNNDGDAHSNGLNNLIGKTIKVGDKDASSSNAAKAFRSFTTSGSIESSGGVYTLSESYGTWGSGKTTINTERRYGRNSTITSSDFSGKALASLIYAGYYLNDSTPTVVNAISEFLASKMTGKHHISSRYITVPDLIRCLRTGSEASTTLKPRISVRAPTDGKTAICRIVRLSVQTSGSSKALKRFRKQSLKLGLV